MTLTYVLVVDKNVDAFQQKILYIMKEIYGFKNMFSL